MNAFFKVKTLDNEYYGIVFGNNESELMKKVTECYEPDEITFQFSECYEGDIVEIADLRENTLFSFQQEA